MFERSENPHSSSNYCCTFSLKSGGPNTPDTRGMSNHCCSCEMKACQVDKVIFDVSGLLVHELHFLLHNPSHFGHTCRISKSLGTFWTQTEFYIFSFDIPLALKDQKEIHLITLMQAQYFSNACVLVTYITVDWTCVPKAIKAIKNKKGFFCECPKGMK